MPPWALPSCPSPSLRRQRIRSPSTHRRPGPLRLPPGHHPRSDRGDDVPVGEHNQGRYRQPRGYDHSFTALVARASMTCLPAASWAPSAPSTRLRWPVHFARPVGVDDVARRPPPLHPPIIYAVRRLLVTRQAPGPRSVSDPVRRRRVGATVTVTATVRAGVAHGYRLPPLGCLRRATPDRMLRGDVAQEGAIGLGAITAALYSRSSPRPVPRLRWRLRRVCRLPPGRLPFHRRGCTDPFTSRIRGRRELITRRLQGSPRIIHADATPRSLHASGGTYDVLAGCLRDVFRSIVAAAPTHSRRASAAVAN